ncbi:hypothetical protein NUSPORA_01364 [Nucleospora cyclopteri]
MVEKIETTFDINDKKNWRKYLLIGGIVIVLILGGIGIYFLTKSSEKITKPAPKSTKVSKYNDNPTLFDFTKIIEKKLIMDKRDILKIFEMQHDKYMVEINQKYPTASFNEISDFNYHICFFHYSKMDFGDSVRFDILITKKAAEVIEFFPFLFPTHTLYNTTFNTHSTNQGVTKSIFTFDYIIQILKRIMEKHLPLSLAKLEAYLKTNNYFLLKSAKNQLIIKVAIESLATFGLNLKAKEFSKRIIEEGKKLKLNANIISEWKQAANTQEVIFTRDILKENRRVDSDESST